MTGCVPEVKRLLAACRTEVYRLTRSAAAIRSGHMFASAHIAHGVAKARNGRPRGGSPAEASHPALIGRVREANIRLMFQAMVTRLHSPRTQSSPRSEHRKPSTDLMMPNTEGSGTCLRAGHREASCPPASSAPVRHGLNRRGIFRRLPSVPCREALVQGRMMRLPAQGDHRLDLRGRAGHHSPH